MDSQGKVNSRASIRARCLVLLCALLPLTLAAAGIAHAQVGSARYSAIIVEGSHRKNHHGGEPG